MVRESVLVVGPVLTSLITLCDTLNLETHRLHYNNITILIIVNKNMHIYIYIYIYVCIFTIIIIITLMLILKIIRIQN